MATLVKTIPMGPVPTEAPTFAKLGELTRLNNTLHDFGETHLSKMGRSGNSHISVRCKMSAFSDGKNRLVAEVSCLPKNVPILREYGRYFVTQRYNVDFEHVTGPLKNVDSFDFYDRIDGIKGINVDCYRLRVWSAPIHNDIDLVIQAEALYLRLVQAYIVFAKYLEKDPTKR